MKQLGKIIVISLLLLQTVAGGFVVSLEQVSAADIPSIPQETALAVDITQDCGGLTEDEVAKDPGILTSGGYVIDPLKGEWYPLLPALFPGIPTLPAGHIDWGVNSFNEWLNAMGFIGAGTSMSPDLQISGGTFSVNEGGSVDLLAEATNFKTPPQKLQYAWWTVEKTGDTETLTSLNGVVAGGEAFGSKDTPISDGSRCGIATRKATLDVDRDGMDDQWERRYAPKGDIAAFNGNDDPDQDGFTAGDFQQNDTGVPFRIVPNSQATNGKKFTTGDGEFTTFEEYIWGTNPLDADTDDDGYPDEADVVGIGQGELKYSPKQVNGESNTIQVDTIGETTLSGPNDNLVTQMLGYRINMPVILQQNLAVSLVSNNVSPQLEQMFQVQALTFGTNADPGNLQYRWDITNNNVPIPINVPNAPCNVKSFNNIIECAFSASSVSLGMKILFHVQVFDPKLAIKAEEEITVAIGGNIVLTSNPTLVPQYPIDQTGENPVAPAGNTATGQRWIEATATLTEGNPENYNFEWYVDDEKVEDTCSRTPLSFTGRAEPAGLTLCGVGTNILYYHATQSNTHKYVVNVRITQKFNGSPLANESMTIYTDPTETPYPGQALASANGLLQVQNTLVAPKQEIVAKAANIETSESHAYQYIWSVDGQVVSSGSEHQLRLTAQPEKEKYDIQLQVIERDGNTVLSQKTATTLVAVTPESKFQLWRASRLATVQTAFYPFYHTMAGNTSLFLVVAGLVLILSIYFIEKKQRALS